MEEALKYHYAGVIEFHVAPQLNPKEGLPHHEWLVSFSNPPKDMDAFAKQLDQSIQRRNIYYADLIKGKILNPLNITSLSPNAFNEFMKERGKLGGQNRFRG